MDEARELNELFWKGEKVKLLTPGGVTFTTGHVLEVYSGMVLVRTVGGSGIYWPIGAIRLAESEKK